MEKGKTIKEIAEEIGVSKQAIRNQIAKLGLQSSLQKNGNQFTIDKQQETLILQEFSDKTQSQSQSGLHSETQRDTERICDILKETIDTLRLQLEVKDDQIQELMSTIRIQGEIIKAQTEKPEEPEEKLIDEQVKEEKPMFSSTGRIFPRFTNNE